MHTILLTTLALIAFAANSILCRMALGSTAIDPASFSTIRLVFGAVMLWAIMKITAGAGATRHSGSWISAAMLFLYAVAFSFAYVSLDAGMGALILFGSVQATMISFGLSKGERPHLLTWCGLLLALVGLVYLVLPGLEAPSFSAAAGPGHSSHWRCADALGTDYPAPGTGRDSYYGRCGTDIGFQKSEIAPSPSFKFPAATVIRGVYKS